MMNDIPIGKIKKGDLIIREKPFVYALQSKYRLERCDLCFSGQKLLKCSACQYVYYCNRNCQREAWSVHKDECKYLKKMIDKPIKVIPDAARIIMRIILKLNTPTGKEEKGFYTKDKYRIFDDLMSHADEIQLDRDRMEHIESLSMVLRDLIDDHLMPNRNELVCIYGRVLINAFNILEDELTTLGTGIYLGISITNHNCKPNVMVTFEGTTISMRAIEDMDKLDWSKIFISYIDVLNDTKERRACLEKNYFFTCDCEKCNGIATERNDLEMNSIACPNGNCQEFIFDGYGKCPKCLIAIPMDTFDKYTEILNITKMHAERMKDTAYIDVCQMVLKLQNPVFHKLNVWHLKVLDLAFDGAIELAKWDDALNYGLELLNGYRKYLGDFNPLLGLLYMKIGKIQLHKEQPMEAYKHLHYANEIFKITHGQNHRLYKQHVEPLFNQSRYESQLL